MVLAAWESVVGMSKTLLLIIVPTVSDTVREGRTVRTSGNGASERSRMKAGSAWAATLSPWLDLHLIVRIGCRKMNQAAKQGEAKCQPAR